MGPLGLKWEKSSGRGTKVGPFESKLEPVNPKRGLASGSLNQSGTIW